MNGRGTRYLDTTHGSNALLVEYDFWIKHKWSRVQEPKDGTRDVESLISNECWDCGHTFHSNRQCFTSWVKWEPPVLRQDYPTNWGVKKATAFTPAENLGDCNSTVASSAKPATLERILCWCETAQ